jgi:hypothetical protein
MPLIKKPFKRRAGFRDARLIIIATEGKNTEPIYFNGLKVAYHKLSVQVEVLERTTSGSSPAHVQRELDGFKKEYHLVTGDELWMVIDRDRWAGQHLSEVAQRCIQKGYFLAVSVPCFETWLLLHITDQKPEDFDGLNCEQVGAKIRKIHGSYNKSNPDLAAFIPNVAKAIERARKLDINPSDRWPQQPGTRVYLLVEKITSQ